MNGVNQLHRKEDTIYSAGDLWTKEDDELFLKYCNEPFLRLYHKMSRDVSNRPYELLNTRLRDIKECVSPDGAKYAKLTIGAGGKTKQREVVLYESYPYYLEYIQKYHPSPKNPNSFLFKNRGNGFQLQNVPIKSSTLTVYYWKYKKNFPKLLDQPESAVPSGDKEKIRLLLLTAI